MYLQLLKIHRQILWNVHQTLGNMIRTYELEKFEFDYNDPWSQLLSNCAWVIRSTVHSVLDATLAQIML